MLACDMHWPLPEEIFMRWICIVPQMGCVMQMHAHQQANVLFHILFAASTEHGGASSRVDSRQFLSKNLGDI